MIRKSIVQKTATTRLWLLALLAMLGAGTVARAEPTDATEIMNEMFRVSTEGRRASKVRMTVSDDSGREKVREMSIRALRGDGQRKSLVLIEAPADSRGTGFMSISPERGSGGERWMYLPSLKRVTRIANSGMSASFMGSDLSYADLSQPSPDMFVFSMKESQVNVDGEDCWLILAKPKDAEAKETLGYEELELWVSKRAFLAVRMRASLTSGNKVKYLKASDLKKVGKYWVAHRTEARTVARDKLLSKTVLVTQSMSTDDPSVTDAEFTKARLEQGL